MYDKHLFLDLQSSVHAVLEFVSPENVTEGIQLFDEVRLLPEDHKAKADMLEVDLVNDIIYQFLLSPFSCTELTSFSLFGIHENRLRKWRFIA